MSSSRLLRRAWQVRDSGFRLRLANKFRHKPTTPPLALRAQLTEKEEQEDMWLEEIDSERALSWVKERNEETLQVPILHPLSTRSVAPGSVLTQRMMRLGARRPE